MVPVPYGFVYNFEGFSLELTAVGQRQAMSQQRVVVSHFSNVPDLDDPFQVTEAEGTAGWASIFIDPADDPTEPMSAIYYPIIDAVDSIKIDADKEQSVVGVLTFVIFWRELIKNILPTNSNGVIVVIENACDQVFTYQLNGPETVYLGQGDLHDPKYDHLGRTSSLFDLMDTGTSDRKSSYTGIPLTEEFCPKTLSVYPSQEMQDDHVSSDPVLFTVAAALIFVFTSLIFFLYDWLVERRQKKVMKTAVQSTAIVSSLFPSQVRDRLFNDNAEVAADKAAKRSQTLILSQICTPRQLSCLRILRASQLGAPSVIPNRYSRFSKLCTAPSTPLPKSVASSRSRRLEIHTLLL